MRALPPAGQQSKVGFTPVAAPNPPYRLPLSQTPSTMMQSSALQPITSGPIISATPLPLPRSILPKNRSIFDKMVEYLVGDGPSNRYALICKNCEGHNGKFNI